jgi:hypothetical protein
VIFLIWYQSHKLGLEFVPPSLDLARRTSCTTWIFLPYSSWVCFFIVKLVAIGRNRVLAVVGSDFRPEPSMLSSSLIGPPPDSTGPPPLTSSSTGQPLLIFASTKPPPLNPSSPDSTGPPSLTSSSTRQPLLILVSIGLPPPLRRVLLRTSHSCHHRSTEQSGSIADLIFAPA